MKMMKIESDFEKQFNQKRLKSEESRERKIRINPRLNLRSRVLDVENEV